MSKIFTDWQEDQLKNWKSYIQGYTYETVRKTRN